MQLPLILENFFINILSDCLRNYDPETGRYLSSDPIGLVVGLSIYTYVLNNPLNFFDPKGLATFSFGAGGLFQQTAARTSMSGIKDIGIGGGVAAGPQDCMSRSNCF
jgi:uncharacterized protein RhaS with RHS repeats